MSKNYLLDSNVFIEAKNRHYGFDFGPAFWDWIVLKCQEGLVISIDKVYDELAPAGDDLSDWIKKINKNFFHSSSDKQIIDKYEIVSNWVNNQDYEQAKISDFLHVADPWLIAHCLANRHILVTHETPADKKKTKKPIKIPDICKGLGVECITTFPMLRETGARFVLQAR